MATVSPGMGVGSPDVNATSGVPGAAASTVPSVPTTQPNVPADDVASSAWLGVIPAFSAPATFVANCCVSERTLFSSRSCTLDTSITAPTVSAMPVRSVVMAVMRTRTDGRTARTLRRIVHQPVAEVAHRLDGVDPERHVDLASEVAHVHLHDVRVAAEVVAP